MIATSNYSLDKFKFYLRQIILPAALEKVLFAWGEYGPVGWRGGFFLYLENKTCVYMYCNGDTGLSTSTEVLEVPDVLDIGGFLRTCAVGYSSADQLPLLAAWDNEPPEINEWIYNSMQKNKGDT